MAYDWRSLGNPFVGLDSGAAGALIVAALGRGDQPGSNEGLVPMEEMEKMQRQRPPQQDPIIPLGPRPPPDPYDLPSGPLGYITQLRNTRQGRRSNDRD